LGFVRPEHSAIEIVAVREIVQALLTAERPDDVFRSALERVSPLVGATFASVYLIDGRSELMRLAASYNWPEQYAPWLDDMRVRVGFGPSGEAASERRAIEVPDVFADPGLEDWQEVAQELGFRALIALPLQSGQRVLGAVTFYFADSGSPTVERRALLRLVAAQMAATAEKAALIGELRDAQRVREEFLTNISHELRTPLTTIMGYIALLQDELAGPLTERQRADLRHARDAGERLPALIDDLLELTALAKGTVDVRADAFDPREPIRDAVARCRPAPALGPSIDEPAGLLPCVCSDRGKLTKILVHLLDNAYKFAGDGAVTISLHVERDRAVYRVSDSGAGVPSASRGIIFDDFRQGDGSLTRRYGGTGMGLALSRRLARLLGGEIDLESAPDQGSTFTVGIPLEYRVGEAAS
jgi:signal transduction histidine kinase